MTRFIIWDMDKYRPIQQVYRHSGGILDISMDKKHIVSCSKDNTVCVWYRSEYSKYGFEAAIDWPNGRVNSVQLNGNHVLSAGKERPVLYCGAFLMVLVSESLKEMIVD